MTVFYLYMGHLKLEQRYLKKRSSHKSCDSIFLNNPLKSADINIKNKFGRRLLINECIFINDGKRPFGCRELNLWPQNARSGLAVLSAVNTARRPRVLQDEASAAAGARTVHHPDQIQQRRRLVDHRR